MRVDTGNFVYSVVLVFATSAVAENEWSGLVNGFTQDFTYNCPDDLAISGVASVFSNHDHDRSWEYRCSSGGGLANVTRSCSLQANINAQYGSIDFDCPAGGYIGGFKSEFNPTDRIWSVNCCTRQHATLVNCTIPSTLWENSLENVLNWTTSSGRVLAGIQSFYSAFDRDRRWRFKQCEIQVSCGDPGIPANSMRSGDSFLYNDEVVFTCNNGYSQSSGPVGGVRKCLNTGLWSDSQPVCTRAAVAENEWSGLVNGFTQDFTYNCPDNLAISGVASVFSDHDHDRSWEYRCSIGGGLANITTSCSLQANINVVFGSMDFDCPAGGYIGGIQSTYSPADRIWSVNCCTRQHATLVNCTIPSTLWENQLEEVLNWTASSGRVLAGIQSFYSPFNRDRRWRFRQCEIQVSCGDPGIPANSMRSGDSFLYNDEVVFTCNNGYNQSSGPVGGVRRCLDTGLWSDSQPVCTRAAVPENEWSGLVNGFTQDFTYNCPNNLAISGVASVFSDHEHDRSWEFRCSRGGGLANATTSCSLQANINVHSGSINFYCPAGGYFGGFQSTYSPTDRIWSVNCCTRQHATLVNCTVPSTLWENSLENVLNWTARSGRVLAGIQSFYGTLESDRRWRFRQCEIQVSCGDPGIPANSMRSGDSFLYGDEVVFTCNNGYNQSSGPVGGVRQCLGTGLWSDSQPVCTLISVPTPSFLPPSGDGPVLHPWHCIVIAVSIAALFLLL